MNVLHTPDGSLVHRPAVPPGFEPMPWVSPVIELIGPIFARGKGRDLELGMRAERKHCNLRGTVHGGILAALADLALCYPVAFASNPPTGMVTANLSIDYAGSARGGDWLTTRTDVQRHGGRMAFANCYISINEQRIVRASAVLLLQEWPDGSPKTE